MKKKVKYLIFFILFVFVLLIINISYYSNNLPNNIYNINKVEYYDDNNDLITSYYNKEEKTIISLNEIDSNFIKHLIKIEDKRFYEHKGYDKKRLVKVFFTNLSNKKKQGASTITQQLARNLFLSNIQTYERKAKELFYSIALEKKYSKDTILESYLNNIYYGQGIYGIYDATNYYFNKDPKNLSTSEILILLSIIKNPSLSTNIEKLFNRSKELSNILNIEFNDNYELSLTKKNKDNSKNYYIDYVNTIIFSSNIINDKPYTIKVYTNINKDLTKYSYNLIQNSHSKANQALVAIEPHTGKVKAIIGNKDYDASKYNIALYSKRQIGSTVKAFNYYNAINHGFDPTTTFISEKTTFNDITIKNYNDKYENDKITLAYALATSDNIYSVKTHLFLGKDKLKNTLESLKFEVKDNGVYLPLGNNESSLLTLTNGYNTLASLGSYYKPKFINKVIFNNNIIYEEKIIPRQVLNYTSSYLTNELLTNTFDSSLRYNITPTGSSIQKYLTHKYAGKSGLTDFDSYFIGYNNKITIGVWTGYDDNLLIKDYQDLINSKTIWYQSIEYYLANETNTWYETPYNVETKYLAPNNLNPNYKKTLYFRK